MTSMLRMCDFPETTLLFPHGEFHVQSCGSSMDLGERAIFRRPIVTGHLQAILKIPCYLYFSDKLAQP